MTLTVFGRLAAVSRALKSLETALDVGEESRQVPLSVIPVVIGRGGATIKRLQQDSGATFDINRNTGSVKIHGKQDAVAAAVRMLDGLLAEQGGLREHPILAKQVPLIIGRGGSTIKALQAESGAAIAVSKEDNCVRIRGPQAAIDKAVELLTSLLEGRGRGGALAGGSEAPPGLGGAPLGVSRPGW
jgi:far upstream element-binding protein